ncbi:hypothetical protein BOTBODRAFT_154498 [Botryobasidium botryosum FD-172 SS1]|uniref:Dolichyl-diphosphooligosaccharide--protein glycosyltransferase subunit WBP1 n=1 Tax=Botryobasidium botryosum (strain FD-172 SS1) TaxID=930990 RepID=A0A067MSH0_BOTB1|nr:hypothetical protein BOTBODRAFT_154498 [Botryobasidium botryosum FD-172 SS1]
MWSIFKLALPLVLFISPLLSQAGSSAGSSVLVVLEPELKREDFSLFFNSLEKRGYELTFRAPLDKTPKIAEHGIPAFSHVIFFTPTTKSEKKGEPGFAPDLSPQSLVSLATANQNINILIALSPSATPFTSLASEFSLSLPPPKTPLISHFPPRPFPPTTLIIPYPETPSPLLTAGTPPILLSGVSHAIGDNPLLVPILNAPAESFASDSEEDRQADLLVEATERGGEGLWAGSQMGVVTGFQTKNGARVMWVGGVSVFSNEFAEAEVAPGQKSGNAQFAKDITAWTFQETMVLRIDEATHHSASDPLTVPKEMYTTNEHLTYIIQLSAFDAKTDTWIPYSSVKDLQLEFTMLDPHIRTALKAVDGVPGAYSVTFRAPDRHGVYKFVVDYKRKGYTSLHSSLQVSIVPPRHDGYPRFLSAAWPYYAGAISTSAGFILFCAIYLGAEVSGRGKGKGGKSLKGE